MTAHKKSVIYNDNLELPGIPCKPKKLGRPVTGYAMTNAERQRKYRQGISRQGTDSLTVFVSVDVLARLERFMLARDETKSEVVECALRTFFRKR